MSIPSAKYLKKKAGNRLEGNKEAKKLVLIYAGILAGSSLVVNAVKYLLDGQISQTGGLQGISTRSLLSTTSTALTIAQMLLVMCLTLGYTAAMLRIARGQYASQSTLKAGVERVWVLLRTRLLQAAIFIAITLALGFLTVNLYFLTPFANRLLVTTLPLAEGGTMSAEAMLSLWDTAYTAMLPLLIIYLVLLIPMTWLYSCTYRMVDYLLIDRPQLGAFGVLRESRRMMHGNMKMMFRVDVSFWWYYLLQWLVSCLIYLDILLAIFGVSLPLSPVAYFFAIVLAYLAADFALRYFFSNRIAVTYALFYDSLCPKQPQDGAVLGNIFQM